MRIAGFFAILLAFGPASSSPAMEPKRLLVVTTTTGWRHSSIPTAEKVIAQLAARSGAFTVDFVRQPAGKPSPPRTPPPFKPDGTPAEQAASKAAFAKFAEESVRSEAALAKWRATLATELQKLSPASLAAYDGVMFVNTTGDLPLPDPVGFLAWIASGKAFIGVHSASDTLLLWPDYLRMVGAGFDRHDQQVGVELVNRDPRHPATAHLGATWRIPQEEIYLFRDHDPAPLHPLLGLNRHPNRGTPGVFPISWTRNYGKGRVFYTALGHREDLWDDDPSIPDRKNPVEVSREFQSHLLGGILWALDLPGIP